MSNQQKKKSIWPYGLIAFFVVFISWIGIFIGIAVSNSQQLVGADYYEQEIRYQERIDAIKRLNALTGFAMKHNGDAKSVSVQLPEEHIGKAVDGSFKFYRPDNAKLDQLVSISMDANRRQSLSTEELKSGSWKLEASWELNGERFYSSLDLSL